MTDAETIKLLRAKIRAQAQLLVEQAELIQEQAADLAERRRRIDQLESTIIATQA